MGIEALISSHIALAKATQEASDAIARVTEYMALHCAVCDRRAIGEPDDYICAECRSAEPSAWPQSFSTCLSSNVIDGPKHTKEKARHEG